MEVKIEDLQIIFNKLISQILHHGITVIRIDHDYYWNIPSEDLYDSYEKPVNLDLGQLSFDWNDLLKILNDSNDPLISDFIDLAAILRAIGDLGETYFYTHD